jgi:hypothetical protein
MCFLIVYTIFDFPDESTLKDSANIARFLTELTQNTTFRIADEGFETPQAAWNAALRRGQRSVYVALVNDKGYELSFSVVMSDWRRLYVSGNRAQTSKPENAHAMVEASSILYRTLQPDYGFGLVSMDMQPLDPPGEGDFSVKTLHDFNFFSPRLVNKIGASMLNMIPSHRSVAFGDGGFLIEMSSNPLAKSKNDAASYEASATILRIPKFQQGC